MTALMPAAPPQAARRATSAALDVLVIGAGQAGLAIGYHLRTAGARFELVERNQRIGDSWRQRYDSLSLFTPRSYSHLPGLLLDADQAGYPTRDEIADYFGRYAAHFDIPVRLGTAVVALERRAADSWPSSTMARRSTLVRSSSRRGHSRFRPCPGSRRSCLLPSRS